METFTIAAATLVATAGFGQLLDGSEWWFVVALGVLIVLVASAATRSFARRPAWSLAGGAIALLLTLTLFFAPGSAVLGLIPTPGTVGAFADLIDAGGESIATQQTPANAVTSIVFLVTLGVAVLALVMDALAALLRRPALVGAPLLLILLVPSLVDNTLTEPFVFALTAVAYLFLLYRTTPRAQAGVGFGVGAAAVIGGLVLSSVLPPVLPRDQAGARVSGYTTGVNPIVNLGDDLRRRDPVTALTYTTDQTTEEYFTLTVLTDFEGDEWAPEIPETGSRDLEAIGPAPGIDTDEVQVEKRTTEIQVGNIQGRWLPLPYAPSAIEGLEGDWYWSDDTLSVRSTDSNMRNQQYTVVSDIARPTSNQLEGATVVEPADFDNPADYDEFTTVPDELPDIVRETAVEVTADADTDFDRALALQEYFTGGLFDYSVDAPVENGYDGSGAEVIGQFLEARSGYCVHFSSAMAAMARTLGIPSRVAVGFTPGESSTDMTTNEVTYTVTTDALHAWPELYFRDIGWVRFEPTVGIGSAPNFPTATPDDPSTPEDESTPTPTATPTSSATPTTGPDRDTDSSSSGATRGVLSTSAIVGIAIGLAVIIVLLLPLIVRAVRRRRRYAVVSSTGSAFAAWRELSDRAVDLGIELPESETPRETEARFAAAVRESDAEALDRLARAVESASFDRGLDEGATIADLRRVSDGLASGATRSARLAAVFAPASVLARFRGRKIPE